jgi:alkanesulfonate monooxygenase SsuD/methylene tetrahydromethanopterin reductase-like flavin-dependent oxidoreductase (luciferase family)
MPVPELRSLIEGYRAERAAAGFDGPISVTLQATVYVAESAAQARADTEAGLQRDKEIALEMARNIGDQEAYERLSRRYSFTYDDQLQRPGLGVYPNPYIFGSPEEVAERLQEYQEQLGITGISMTLNPGGIPQDLVVASMRRLAERVIPRLN